VCRWRHRTPGISILMLGGAQAAASCGPDNVGTSRPMERQRVGVRIAGAEALRRLGMGFPEMAWDPLDAIATGQRGPRIRDWTKPGQGTSNRNSDGARAKAQLAPCMCASLRDATGSSTPARGNTGGDRVAMAHAV
jgi:hypothetical protein